MNSYEWTLEFVKRNLDGRVTEIVDSHFAKKLVDLIPAIANGGDDCEIRIGLVGELWHGGDLIDREYWYPTGPNIFPSEYFEENTSPNRVPQKYCREWVKFCELAGEHPTAK